MAPVNQQYPDWNLPPKNPDFVGRQRLKARILDFVTDPKSRGYLVVVGGMGKGKTSFLTDFIYDEMDRGLQPICHFIGYHPSTTGERKTIARSLFVQLYSKYPNVELPSEWQRDQPTFETQLEWLLQHVSKLVSSQAEMVHPEALYIDGADQADVNERSPLVPGVLRDLPPGVVSVITSRPDVLRWLQTRRNIQFCSLDRSLGLVPAPSKHPADEFVTDTNLALAFDALLPDLQEAVSATSPPECRYSRVHDLPEALIDDREDVGLYLECVLPRVLRDESPEAVNRLIRGIVSQSAPPVFFTVDACCRRLESGKLSQEERVGLLTQPGRWCVQPEALVEDEAIRVVARVEAAGLTEAALWNTLGLIAVAQDSLSESTLRSLGLWSDGQSDKVLRAAINFFRPRDVLAQPHTPYEFDHPSYVREVRKHLIDDEPTLHARLADACLRWRLLNDTARRYALRYGPKHLVAAGHWDHLRRLLTNFDWLQSKLEATTPQELVADYDHLPASDPVHTIGNAIRLSAEILSRGNGKLMGRGSRILAGCS